MKFTSFAKLLVVFLIIEMSFSKVIRQASLPPQIQSKTRKLRTGCPHAFATPGATQGGLINNQNLETRRVTARGLFVYRMYTKDGARLNKAGPMSPWWTMFPPAGNKNVYMEANAICPSENDLNIMIKCELNVGAEFCVGQTESRNCPGGPIRRANVNIYQTYIDGLYRKQVFEVTGLAPRLFASCQDAIPSPLR